jgi:hypothetical protein
MRSLQERLITEDAVERHLLRQVAAARGKTMKVRFMRGWPDRVVLLPGGKLVFVELKRPVGGVFEPLQLRIHKMLDGLGFTVAVCHNKNAVDNFMKELQ